MHSISPLQALFEGEYLTIVEAEQQQRQRTLSNRPSRADILARAVARRKYAQPGYGGILGAGVLTRKTSSRMMSKPQWVLTAALVRCPFYSLSFANDDTGIEIKVRLLN
jgi:hypothetical protein